MCAERSTNTKKVMYHVTPFWLRWRMEGTNTHKKTDKHTDIATYTLNWPMDRFIDKVSDSVHCCGWTSLHL